MSARTIIHQTDLTASTFATHTMKQRVWQGDPEERVVKVNDQPYTAYIYTDGIRTILSIFLPNQLGVVEEIIVDWRQGQDGSPL